MRWLVGTWDHNRLDTGTTVIRSVKSVRDLGVHLDSEVMMKTHISKVVSSCHHQLRRIRQVRRRERPQAWARGHLPPVPPRNVEKCFLLQMLSKWTKYLCIILRKCRQRLGFLPQIPPGSCPWTLLGDFRPSDPLIAHPWKKSWGRPCSPARQARWRSTAGFSIHFIATWLLQLTVVSSARVYYLASAAGDECRGSSHHELIALRDHVKPALKQLQWLPVEQSITYKPCLFTHYIHIGLAPQYLSDCVSTDADWGLLAHRFTFCQEQELDLENVASSTPVQPPGTLFHPTFTTLLIPVHSENDTRL